MKHITPKLCIVLFFILYTVVADAATQKTANDTFSSAIANSNYNQYFFQLILIVITGVVTYWFTKRGALSKRKSISMKELYLLLEEMNDIKRHCNANISFLEKILTGLHQGVPSPLYFRRMKIYEYNLLFSQETFKALPPLYIESFIRLRLAIRNVNIEIDTLLSYVDKAEVSEDVVKEYLEFIIAKANYCIDKVTAEEKVFIDNETSRSLLIQLFINKKREPKGWLSLIWERKFFMIRLFDFFPLLEILMRYSDFENPEKNRPVNIIYERKFPNRFI